MANRTLSDLPIETSVAGSDILHMRKSLTDKSITQTKIAEYVQNNSDYSPVVVNVTGTTHTVSTTIRKQIIITSISSNCTMTFPGTYGDGKEIVIINDAASTANVLGLPNSEVLYPGQEIVFVWDGSAFIKRKFINQVCLGTAAPTITPGFVGQGFIDYTNDQLYFATGTSSSADWINSRSVAWSVETKDSDYTLTTADLNKMIIANPNGTQKGLLNIMLPAGSATIVGRPYIIKHGANQGLVKIPVNTGSGNKIIYQRQQLDYLLLYTTGDYWELIWDGVNWSCSGSTIMIVGWQNRAAWANKHLGNGVNYDDGSTTSTKSVDWTGMVVTEATSSFSGIVVEDTGGATKTGIFYIYELSSGFTFWTNNRVLTASNGETIDVNEATGTSKDQDSSLFHEFGVNLRCISRKELYISSDGSENNSFLVSDGTPNELDSGGYNFLQISTLAIKLQTYTAGIQQIIDAGTGNKIDSEDYYENIIVGFSN